MVSEIARYVQLFVPMLWLGMVLAISFLEAPLKFRAPGVTLALGLGIGRLVFKALNTVEVILAIVLIASCFAWMPGTTAVTVLALTAAVLLIQVAAIRPPLTRRSNRILAGEDAPRSRMHVAYVALELAKIVLLIALAFSLTGAVAACAL